MTITLFGQRIDLALPETQSYSGVKFCFMVGEWYALAYPPRRGFDTYYIRLRKGSHVLEGTGSTAGEAAAAVESMAQARKADLQILTEPELYKRC